MGSPNPNPLAEDTIRITVQLEVPYKHDLMNYGEEAKKVFRDYVNSDKFGSFQLENGPSKTEFKGE
jgi:hypothetical protein